MSAGSELQTLLEQFVLVLQNERNASEHTIRAYRRELAGFADYAVAVLGADAQVRAVDHLHIRGYMAALYDRGLTKASVARSPSQRPATMPSVRFAPPR